MAIKVKVKKKAAPARKAPLVKQQRRGRSSTSRISAKHQVTIPVEVLRSSNLVIGDEVEITVNENGVVEVKKVAPINLFQQLAEEVGDALNGFDWEKERAEAWD